MRLSMLALCLLSTTALAHKLTVAEPPWMVEYTLTNGQYSRSGGFNSKAECEAAIEAEVKKQNGYNGHCVKFENGKLIGTQDPAWIKAMNSPPGAR